MKIYSYIPKLPPPLQTKLRLIVQSAGIPYQEFQDENELADSLTKSLAAEKILIFAEYPRLPKLASLSVKNEQHRLCLFVRDEIGNILSVPEVRSKVHSFIAVNDEEIDTKDVLCLIRKIDCNEIHGLEKYLGFESGIRSRLVENDQQKRQALTEIEDFLTGLTFGEKDSRFTEYARRLCELTDELLLNAVFDANPRLYAADRNSPFKLAAHESVHVKWGFDGELFGVSVSDPFGSLTQDTVFKYITAENDTTPLSQRKSGGMGLRFVFDRLHHFIINVTPEKRTELIALARLEKRLKHFDRRLKSLHFFSEKGRPT